MRTLLLLLVCLTCSAQPPAPPSGIVVTNKPKPVAVPVQSNAPPVVLYTNRVFINVTVPTNYPWVLVFRSSNVWDGYSVVGTFSNGTTFTDTTSIYHAYYIFWPNAPLVVQATNQ